MATTLTQSTFRGRNDDGNEVTATYKPGVNGDNWSQEVNQNFRIRFEVTWVGDAVTPEVVLSARLQFRYTPISTGIPGAWVNVNTGTEDFFGVTSSSTTGFFDGQDCTQQIGAGAPYETNNNGCDDSNGLAGPCTLTGVGPGFGDQAEFEYCLVIIGDDVANGDIFEFRIVNGATLFDAYADIPQVTVIKVAAELVRRRPVPWFLLREAEYFRAPIRVKVFSITPPVVSPVFGRREVPAWILRQRRAVAPTPRVRPPLTRVPTPASMVIPRRRVPEWLLVEPEFKVYPRVKVRTAVVAAPGVGSAAIIRRRAFVPHLQM